MIHPNGHNDNGSSGLMQEPEENEILNSVPIPPLAPAPLPELATRAKQRAKQQIQQNRFVIIGAGAIVVALLVFVATSMPHRGGPQKAKGRSAIANDDVDRGNQQRKQRQESVPDHRFRTARHKRIAPRFSERTRPAANGNRFGIECFADRAGEPDGNVGIDTAFRRTGMASAALPAGLKC